ncbi:MAG: hypothetical protein E7058_01755 [Lentisphaerae bacterium]|nr:hypothetical protein [Lentisphaerota bacterium]
MNRSLCLFAISTLLTAGAGTVLTDADWNTLDVPSRKDLRWQQLAPGDGGTSWYLRIHPADDQCMVQSCDMQASYITHDGSKSYASTNDPDWGFPRMHYISAVDFCIDHPDTGFAGCESNGIFKTSDRGRTWERVSTEQIENIFGGKFKKVPISALCVHPANPNEVWAGTGFPRRLEIRGKRRLPQGLIVTRDGGKNWEHLPDAFPKGEMALHILMFKELPGHIFVVTDGGIHLSTDDGRTFAPMMEGLPANMVFCDMDGMIDPASGQLTLVCAMESSYRKINGKYHSSGGVWKCEYPGGIWQEITGNLRFPTGLMADLPDFKSGLASSPYGLIAVKTAFENFMAQPANQQLYRQDVLDYRKDPAPFHRKWSKVRNSKEISKIADEVRRTAVDILPDFHTVRIDPRDPRTVYVSIFNTWVPYGVWKTTDGGKNWFCITRGAQAWKNPAWQQYVPKDSPLLNIKQAWTTRHPMNYGTPKLSFGYWDIRKFDLSRSNPELLYFHSHRVTYRSTDGGRTWQDASNAIIDPARERFRGLGNSNMCVFDLEINRKQPAKILFWMADCGLKISEDGGKTFLGLPHIMAGSNQWVLAAAFDPDDPERFYAVFNCRDWLVGGLRGQYFIESRDFGKSFVNMHVDADGTAKMPPVQKMFTTNIANLLVDPASPANNRRFLATHTEVERYGVFSVYLLAGSKPGVGIIESTDHGKTWHPCNTGLGSALNIVDLVPAPGSGFQKIYAASAVNPRSKFTGGLFVSTDRGKTWQPIPCPLSSVSQVVPVTDGRIFIAGGSRVSSGGVFVSSDGGKSWKKLLSAPQVSTLAVNPVNPDIIYCTVERNAALQIKSPGVWRSADGGKSWDRVNSGMAGSASGFTRLKWHPADPAVLFAGTYGCGYYQLTDPDIKQ